VVTPVTLQGVEDIVRDAVICTDDPDRFAAAIIDLAGSRQARAALAGRALEAAGRHFGRETCHAAFSAWLGSGAGPS
jgi:hypothetical protein